MHHVFDNAKDAAFAIDTIMRKHGLDESRTNFPKVVVSRSKSAKSKKTKLADANKRKAAKRVKKRGRGISDVALEMAVRKNAKGHVGQKIVDGVLYETKRYSSAEKAKAALKELLVEVTLPASVIDPAKVSFLGKDPYYILGVEFTHYFSGYGDYQCLVEKYLGHGNYQYVALDPNRFEYTATGIIIIKDIVKGIKKGRDAETKASAMWQDKGASSHGQVRAFRG